MKISLYINNINPIFAAKNACKNMFLNGKTSVGYYCKMIVYLPKTDDRSIK